MCSIFGAIGDIEGAYEAFSTLEHRGRDSSKFLEEQDYFFGSHRLAITTFGKEQKQPIKNGNFIATFNGEIYNYKELIAKYKLKAQDEIDVILELFLMGKDLHSELRGMFAIAIFNTQSKELWLYRDIAGKKPLYFMQNGNNFYFASEIKALQRVIKNLELKIKNSQHSRHSCESRNLNQSANKSTKIPTLARITSPLKKNSQFSILHSQLNNPLPPYTITPLHPSRTRHSCESRNLKKPANQSTKTKEIPVSTGMTATTNNNSPFSILNSQLTKRVIHQFLGFGATISPTTLFKNIHKLPPASSLYFNGKDYKLTLHDKLLEQKVEIFNQEEATKQYEQALIDAISVRIPKVKYGVLLSGGLDSSLVSALLAKQSQEPLNLFSIGYEGYQKYDERAYAKEVAKHLGANFYEFNFTKVDFFATIEEMLNYIDDPIGDPAQIPLFFLIKKAKEQGIKVLFSGDGSDELNLGYRVYKEYLMMEQVKELPYANWLKNHLRSHFSLNKEWEWYKRALNKEVIFRSSAEIYTDRQLNKLLRLQAKDNTNFEAIKGYWQEFQKSGRDIIDWYSYCDLKVNLAEFFLVKVDRVSMANGVEVRTPFLDNNLLELTFKIDSKVRYNPTEVKPIIKQIASKHLPRTIVHRKKKGLNYPFIEWILEENGIEVIYQANKKFKLFKEEQLDFLSSKASSGKFKQHLFPLYLLSRWLLK